MTEMHKIA